MNKQYSQDISRWNKEFSANSSWISSSTLVASVICPSAISQWSTSTSSSECTTGTKFADPIAPSKFADPSSSCSSAHPVVHRLWSYEPAQIYGHPVSTWMPEALHLLPILLWRAITWPSSTITSVTACMFMNSLQRLESGLFVFGSFIISRLLSVSNLSKSVVEVLLLLLELFFSTVFLSCWCSKVDNKLQVGIGTYS